MKMKMEEIRAKELPDLERLLRDNQEELRHLKTKAAGNDLKDVRSIRKVRLLIARVSARLNELKANKTK